MDLKEIVERQHSERLYFGEGETLVAVQMQALENLYDFNHSRPSQEDYRQKLLREMFAELGEGCHIEQPFQANWGGRHVHFGDHVYANFNLTLVDDTHIYVGNDVLFGPNVTVCTAAHPIRTDLRRRGVQYAQPIHIGNNVWIGGGSFLMPGITIGDNSVIGANSVVTRDIPANVIAVGNPCRVQRKINEHDQKFFAHDHPMEEI